MIRYFKLVIFFACLGPLAYLLWGFFGPTPFDRTAWGAGLGANPIEKITHTTGDWTLWFLLITLAITPARKLLRLPWLIKFRRMLGLFAFFYACLHFLTYVWLDKFFDVHEMLADIAKRKFITIGLTALCFSMIGKAMPAAALLRIKSRRFSFLMLSSLEKEVGHRLTQITRIRKVLL